MKSRSIKTKTHVIALATSLLLAPLALAKDYEEHGSTPAVNYDEQGQLMVNIGGTNMSIDELRGKNVLNRQNDNLGEIEDIVYSSEGSKATHVVVSTDNWFDGRTALIPLSSLEQPAERDRNDFMDNVRGGVVVLDMEEDRFDSIATFKRGTDLEEYLQSSSRDLATALGLEESEVYDKNYGYRTSFTNRSRSRDAESGSKSTLAGDSQYYRYKHHDEEWQDSEFQVDGHSLKASDLKGTEVVNYDDERLGKVVDILVDENGEDASYLVVRTDNWFDGNHAVIPLDSIKYHSDTQEPHRDDGANWWTGDHIVLDMSEDQFEDIADYMRSEDPNVYIKDNRERIGETYGVNASSIPSTGTYYTFVYSAPYVTEGFAAGRSIEAKNNSKPLDKNHMVELGDSHVKASELEGKAVRANDGKKVAKVADIVADANSGEVEFIVLEGSGIKGKTIVPVSSIESDSKEQQYSHRGDNRATWDGKALTLSANASEFESWASFKEQRDFDSFLSVNAARLSDAFGIDESDLTDSEKDYVFLLDPDDRYQTASSF